MIMNKKIINKNINKEYMLLLKSSSIEADE